MSPPVLVAGVGNVFFGDDGFGVEVARRLCAGPLPPGVEVVDFGIGGLHLAMRLLEPVALLLVVDVLPRGGTPGTLYLVEPEVDRGDLAAVSDGHGMQVPAVLAAAQAMGASLPPIRIVGCDPLAVREGMGLSAPVAAAVGAAARLVLEVVERERLGAARSR